MYDFDTVVDRRNTGSDIASIIWGAVLKSISATHIGSSFSATSHFSEPVFLLEYGKCHSL